MGMHPCRDHSVPSAPMQLLQCISKLIVSDICVWLRNQNLSGFALPRRSSFFTSLWIDHSISVILHFRRLANQLLAAVRWSATVDGHY